MSAMPVVRAVSMVSAKPAAPTSSRWVKVTKHGVTGYVVGTGVKQRA